MSTAEASSSAQPSPAISPLQFNREHPTQKQLAGWIASDPNSVTARVMRAFGAKYEFDTTELVLATISPPISGFVRTEYIDFVKPSEMKSSLMWGVDDYSRPFLAVKSYSHINLEGYGPFSWIARVSQALLRVFCKPSVQVFFPRHTDIQNNWVAGGTNSGLVSFPTDDVVVQQLTKLIQHGEAVGQFSDVRIVLA